MKGGIKMNKKKEIGKTVKIDIIDKTVKMSLTLKGKGVEDGLIDIKDFVNIIKGYQGAYNRIEELMGIKKKTKLKIRLRTEEEEKL